MIDLINKNDVVTGATGELGRTMVRSMAECGANAVCFLASDLASFITGAFLPVTGGNVMTSV